jgi:hypothetical protein
MAVVLLSANARTRYARVPTGSTGASAVTPAGPGDELFSGGTITYSAQYVVHTFTTGGTLVPLTPGEIDMDVVVVGGGGSGGTGTSDHRTGGGGSGGEVVVAVETVDGPRAVTVGAGGTVPSSSSNNGSSSSFGSITAAGGRGGGSTPAGTEAGKTGGPLGGGGQHGGAGGAGTLHNGGAGFGVGGGTSGSFGGGGGAGAGGAGQAAAGPQNGGSAGDGGSGVATFAGVFGGGGGGGAQSHANDFEAGFGGSGGGGRGARSNPAADAVAGTANTGGGGGGMAGLSGSPFTVWPAKAGGSGCVVVRYDPTQFIPAPVVNAVFTGGTITIDTPTLVEHQFLTSASLALIDPGSIAVDYLVVGGGGGSTAGQAGLTFGGGGAGGTVRTGSIGVSATQAVTVGAGGIGSNVDLVTGGAGGSSSLGSLVTAAGGGGGVNTGSGGSNADFSGAGRVSSRGGGGAGGGANGQSPPAGLGGAGGAGVEWPSASGQFYGGGGGGANGDGGSGAAGGSGGGGVGATVGNGGVPTAGQDGRGGGAGGTHTSPWLAVDGGTGVVIVRYDPTDFVPFAPPNITGLLGWWDADDATTITDAGGGAVSQWNDKSGNGHHVVQATAGARPTTGVRFRNVRNVLDFDGGDHLQLASGFGFPQTAFTMFAVWASDTASTVRQGVVVPHNNGTHDFDNANACNLNAGDNTLFAEYSSAGAGAGLAGVGATPWGMYTVRKANASSANNTTIWRGENAASATTTVNAAGTSAALYFGARRIFGGPAERLDGAIAEVVIYSRSLTDDERNAVWAYLAAKWDL